MLNWYMKRPSKEMFPSSSFTDFHEDKRRQDVKKATLMKTLMEEDLQHLVRPLVAVDKYLDNVRFQTGSWARY